MFPRRLVELTSILHYLKHHLRNDARQVMRREVLLEIGTDVEFWQVAEPLVEYIAVIQRCYERLLPESGAGAFDGSVIRLCRHPRYHVPAGLPLISQVPLGLVRCSLLVQVLVVHSVVVR